MNYTYEVLNPWAEVDSVPFRGISPRLESLAGKKIGLYCNFKRAARPILSAIGDRLRKMYPDCELSWYFNPKIGLAEIDGERKPEFERWIVSVDAVILAVGD